MVVCRFWEKGNCRNGESCRFEHPEPRRSNQSRGPFVDAGRNDSRNQPRNPFDGAREEPRRGPRQGDSYRPEPPARTFNEDRGRGQAYGGGVQNSSTERNFRFDAPGITYDLTKDLPEWPFSTYAGAGTTDPPKHFFNPIMEQSAEEIRVDYYLAKLQGREDQAQQAERNAHGAALAEIEAVVKDVHGAIRKVVAAKRDHPNRWDIVDEHKDLGNPNPFVPAQLPAQSSTLAQSSGFGQPSAIGSGGAPFSQNPAPAPGAGFGRPSQLAQHSPGFGQPSQLSQQSAFSQPSRPGGGGFGQPSHVGQPSPFGQPSQPQSGSAFGQPAQSQAGSAFGRASTLGQQPTFGQPSAAGQGTAFGQAPALGPVGGFGKPSPFGQSASSGNNSNPFGQQSSSEPSPFAQASQQPAQANPFGSSSAPSAQASAFGQPSRPPFGQQQGQNAGGFGQSSQPQQSVGGFGQPTGGFAQPAQSTGTSGFNSTPPTNGFRQPTLQLNTSQPTMNGTYTTNPPSATPRDSDPPEEMFGGRKAELEEAYKHVLNTGTFADDIMPEVAPLHNWVGWGAMEKKFHA